MSFNKITIVGYLGRDPELRYTPQGTPVCKMPIATTERHADDRAIVVQALAVELMPGRALSDRLEDLARAQDQLGRRQVVQLDRIVFEGRLPHGLVGLGVDVGLGARRGGCGFDGLADRSCAAATEIAFASMPAGKLFASSHARARSGSLLPI